MLYRIDMLYRKTQPGYPLHSSRVRFTHQLKADRLLNGAWNAPYALVRCNFHDSLDRTGYAKNTIDSLFFLIYYKYLKKERLYPFNRKSVKRLIVKA